jgi:hypothetical protein
MSSFSSIGSLSLSSGGGGSIGRQPQPQPQQRRLPADLRPLRYQYCRPWLLSLYLLSFLCTGMLCFCVLCYYVFIKCCEKSEKNTKIQAQK